MQYKQLKGSQAAHFMADVDVSGQEGALPPGGLFASPSSAYGSAPGLANSTESGPVWLDQHQVVQLQKHHPALNLMPGDDRAVVPQIAPPSEQLPTFHSPDGEADISPSPFSRTAPSSGTGELRDPALSNDPSYVIAYPETYFTNKQGLSPFIFNSPHSGRHYTPHFINVSRLNPLLLRRSEDALVDHLYQFAPDLGAPLMMGVFPRAYLDLNREPYELDPRLISTGLPESVNQKSLRVAAGLGTVARVVGEGLEIYRKPLCLEEVLQRIIHCYFPYHQQLAALINAQLMHFQTAVLIDCHSMPSTRQAGSNHRFEDIILGDRYGTSADPAIVAELSALFEARGLTVALNQPYAGGFITEHYGQPERGAHAIQVEINRGLYMDETRLVPHEGFPALQEILSDVFGSFVRDFQTTSARNPLAAE